MVESEAIQVTRLVTKGVDKLGVHYVIGGSMASIIHGLLRTTMDVDIIANLPLAQVDPFIAELGGAFYADEPMIRQAIEHRRSFNLIHLETMFKVDIFIAKERPFDQQQLKRRIPERISPDSEEQFWVLSAEDVVLAKLDWFRLGAEVSERQWRDILGVLKTQQNRLDIDYLKQWAKALEVADLLDHALQEMGSP